MATTASRPTLATTKWVYKGDLSTERCPRPCGGRIRAHEQMPVVGTEQAVKTYCEKCGNRSQLIARCFSLHSQPESEEMQERTTAIVPWVRAAMDVPQDEVNKVLPAYTAMWGDKVPETIRHLTARFAIAYGLDPIAGELIVLGGHPYVTVQGRIRNAERHDDYEGFDTDWVVDPQVRKAMGLKDGDLSIEFTGYRRNRRPCKAWGIVRASEINGGGTNPVARSHPQEMTYERSVGRGLRHMYAMPLPGVEENPATEADYYRQGRVDIVTGEIAPVVEGELNVEGSTAAQRSAIHSLTNALRIDRPAYEAELMRLFGITSSMNLTAGQASEYIDALTARVKARAHGPRWPNRRSHWSSRPMPTSGRSLQILPRSLTGHPTNSWPRCWPNTMWTTSRP